MTLFTPFHYKPLQKTNIFQSYLRDLDRLFLDNEGSEADFAPTANVVEREKDYLIELELPAVAKKDIEVAFKDNTLIVKGKRHKTINAKEEQYTRIESQYGRFERRWAFEDVDSNTIAATTNDGILSIVLPKKVEAIEKSERKTISIK